MCINLHHVGEPPTNLTAVQSGVGTVLVSWTAPPGPPSGGYHIQAVSAVPSQSLSYAAPAGSSSYNITIEPGVYSVSLMGLSQHFSSERVGAITVTVRGKDIAWQMEIFLIWQFGNFNPQPLIVITAN